LSVTANNAFPASDTFKINMDGHNFTGQIRRVTSSGNRIGIAELNGNSVLLNGSGLLKRLAFGTTISAGAGAFASTGALKYRRSLGGNNISQRGTWQVGRTGFAGVKFTEGTGNTHLGWIRLEWQSAQINGIDFPNTLTAIDWAYESDSNTAITAGAVPEPSSAMMALLASGAVGVLAWRSRKRQGAANAQASTEAVS
jgi:hypothetical protein